MTLPTRLRRLLTLALLLLQLIISWFPLLLFTFFQWTLGRSDVRPHPPTLPLSSLTGSPQQSWAPIVLSVFTFLFTTFSILFLSLRTILHVRRHSHSHDDPSSSSPSSPWSSLEIYGAAYAPLWNAYKESRWWFFLPQMFSIFARAMFVAFAQVSRNSLPFSHSSLTFFSLAEPRMGSISRSHSYRVHRLCLHVHLHSIQRQELQRISHYDSNPSLYHLGCFDRFQPFHRSQRDH